MIRNHVEIHVIMWKRFEEKIYLGIHKKKLINNSYDMGANLEGHLGWIYMYLQMPILVNKKKFT